MIPPTSTPSQPSQEKFSPENIATNNNIVYFIRICISSLAGCMVGILGIVGLYGILCYFLSYALLTGLILLKVNFKTEVYFQSAASLVWDGLFAGLLSYILFWTLFYDIVHLYTS